MTLPLWSQPRRRATRTAHRACPATLGLAVAVACVLVAAPARAQYEAGPFGGYHVFSSKGRLGRYDNDPVSTSFVSSGALGFRLAYLPVPYVGGEAQVTVIPTSTRDDQSTVTVVQARIHAIGTLPIGPFRPFVLFGVGATDALPSNPNYVRSVIEMNLHGGAGVRYDVTKLWGVRFDTQVAAVPRTDTNGLAFESQFLLGVYGNFPWPPTPPSPYDKDGDDITDDKDECPDVAGEIRFGGCPDPDAPVDPHAMPPEQGDDDKGGGDKDDDTPDAPAKPGDSPKPSTPAPAP